jgi:Ser/Thr protein kinase RdoA (MazF antagonist)
VTPASPGRITAGELVVVCSHYDLGVIESLAKFKGGSRSSPKVLIRTATGPYLLKRRAPGSSGVPAKVALSHQVLLELEHRGFPVPHLVGTARGNNSLLELNGHVYELFRFVEGVPYDRTVDAAREAGSHLARLHALLREFVPNWPPQTRSYHRNDQVAPRIAHLPESLGLSTDGPTRDLCRALAELYARAADEADRLGVTTRTPQLVHGDFHPGNLLFHRPGHPSGRLAAVFDFESARICPAVLDAANGAMQFAISRKQASGAAHAPAGTPTWRIALNPDLFSSFFAGYRATDGGRTLTDNDLRAVPWLMIEALVVEAAAPIAATGSFGRADGFSVLATVRVASDWIAGHADHLVGLAAGH